MVETSGILKERLELKKKQLADYIVQQDWHGARDTVSEIEILEAQIWTIFEMCSAA